MASAIPIEEFIQSLSSSLGRTVVNKTGLTGFFEKKDAAQEEEASATHTRMKGTGKYYHVTLRLNHDQWERAHQLAR